MKNRSAKINATDDPSFAGLPLRDLERALRITGGDAALADQIFEQLVRDLPDQLERFLNLKQEEDWRELRRSVHRLRGSVTYCAAPALEHGLSTLESAAASGKPEDIEAQIRALESIVERLVASVHEDER